MQHPRQSLVFLAAPFLSLALACTPAAENTGSNEGTGGSASSGGKSGGGSGGNGSGSGGASSGSGGSSSSGGVSGGNSVGSGGSSTSGGTSGGSGGASGSGGGSGGAGPGTGGGGGTDAAAPADSAGTGGSGGAASDGGLPPLMECSVPSIDRITGFHSTGEGTTVPMKEDGTLLVKEGDHYVAKEKFLNNEWHVLEIVITKGIETKPPADLSKSTGITLTYNTTADLYFQMRSQSHWNGGAHWTTPVPSSKGQTVTKFFPFGAANWKAAPGLEAADQSYDLTIKEVVGLMLIGQNPNDITISGMRIDGYVPPCP
jgi:hypothetical protein